MEISYFQDLKNRKTLYVEVLKTLTDGFFDQDQPDSDDDDDTVETEEEEVGTGGK